MAPSPGLEDTVKHDQILEEAKEALARVFSDTSVPASVTRERLEELLDLIEVDLDALDEDEKDEEA